MDRFVEKDTPLVPRFQRGVRIGFAMAALIALATLVLTEVTSSSLERDVQGQSDLAGQRAEVARLGSLIPLLAGAEDPATADAWRVEIGAAVQSVERRQTALQISHPEFLEREVSVGDSTLRFDRAFERAIDQVDASVELLANEALFASFRAATVSESVVLLAALDPTYADLADIESNSGLNAAGLIRTVGRVLVAVSLVAATLRLLVLGRPLVEQLRVEKREHEEIVGIQREAQMRSMVSSRLTEGLEAVDTEAGVRKVVERTLGRVASVNPAELLLADSSMAHLSLYAQNPHMATPGCGVQSPWSCPAVRRASTQYFDDSEGIRACPHLSNRPDGACAAICVPVAFVGESMGVLHVTGEPGWKPSSFERETLEALASQTAVRLGAIRSFAKAEIQASTDVLTGLPNRRAVEDHLSRFLGTRAKGSVAMADLDNFKAVNDNHGHEAGDRALRMFAEVLRTAVRDNGIAGRWGGEEFVIVLPELAAQEAKAVLDRIREELEKACARGDGPPVTVSIGVVDTNAGSSVDTLVGLADECVYVAKEQGRDRVIVGPVNKNVEPSTPTDHKDEVSA